MQATIDRVIRSLTHQPAGSLPRPLADTKSDAVRQDAMAFASHLLDSYKDQLAHRAFQRD